MTNIFGGRNTLLPHIIKYSGILLLFWSGGSVEIAQSTSNASVVEISCNLYIICICKGDWNLSMMLFNKLLKLTTVLLFLSNERDKEGRGTNCLIISILDADVRGKKQRKN